MENITKEIYEANELRKPKTPPCLVDTKNYLLFESREYLEPKRKFYMFRKLNGRLLSIVLGMNLNHKLETHGNILNWFYVEIV